jgi:Ca2+-binding EF-hand superfamily protein
MRTSNQQLLAVALAAAFAAPQSFAGDLPDQATTKTKASATAAAKTQTDSVSARTTMREAGKAAAGTTTAAKASANPPPGKGNWFADLDADADGQLSVTEAKGNAGVSSRFGSIDANADGYVTLEEYRQFFTSEKSQGELHAQAHSAVVTRDVWTKLDVNDDGKLSSTEVTGNATISGAFSAMDSNGDGFVTQAEYRAYAKSDL